MVAKGRGDGSGLRRRWGCGRLYLGWRKLEPVCRLTGEPSVSEAPVGMEKEKEACLGTVSVKPERRAKMGEKAEIFERVSHCLAQTLGD